MRVGALRALSIAVVALAVLATLFPLAWIVLTAFKTRAEAVAFPPVWIPSRLTLEHFRETFLERGFAENLGNSLIVASASTLLSLAAGVPAAYSLARFRFPGAFREGLGFWILSTRMLPPIVTVVPTYFLARGLGLLDSRAAIAASYAVFNLPFVVWMMRGFFRDIPAELEEAAMMDGTSRLRALRDVTLRLAAPGLAATALFCMILSFNEFMLALTLGTLDAMTLPVAIAGRVTQYKVMWGEMSAAGVVALAPVLLCALLAQKHLVRGLTLGAVKG